eukprot:11860371-Alexandrium_andersonii.AAC.1
MGGALVPLRPVRRRTGCVFGMRSRRRGGAPCSPDALRAPGSPLTLRGSPSSRGGASLAGSPGLAGFGTRRGAFTPTPGWSS